jgi:hypothetical protein
MAYVVAYHICGIGALVWCHAREHGTINPVHVALATFCTLNAWICVCEISLFFYNELIQSQFAKFTRTLGDGVLPSIFLFERATLREILSLRYWAIMWGTYSVLDPAYSDTTSWGFNVDVGNGFTTLIPTLMYAYGMTGSLLSARVLGMIGLVKFYQELYGTIVYFFQYTYNRRFDRSPPSLVWGVVVPANGIWMIFPALGMWASTRLILENTFEVFTQGGFPVSI